MFILSNNQEAVQAVYGSATKVSNSALVRRINMLLAKLEHWSIQHISKDHNKEADCLAKMFVGNIGGTQLFKTPPRGFKCISK